MDTNATYDWLPSACPETAGEQEDTWSPETEEDRPAVRDTKTSSGWFLGSGSEPFLKTTHQRFGVAQDVILEELVQHVEQVVLDQGLDDQLVEVMLTETSRTGLTSRTTALYATEPQTLPGLTWTVIWYWFRERMYSIRTAMTNLWATPCRTHTSNGSSAQRFNKRKPVKLVHILKWTGSVGVCRSAPM